MTRWPRDEFRIIQHCCANAERINKLLGVSKAHDVIGDGDLRTHCLRKGREEWLRRSARAVVVNIRAKPELSWLGARQEDRGVCRARLGQEVLQ